MQADKKRVRQNYGVILAAFFLLSVFSFVGCASEKEKDSNQSKIENGQSETEESQKEVFAMDTYMTVTAFGENAEEAARAAIDEIVRLDELLSTGDEDSEVAFLNKYGKGTLSEDTLYLYEAAMELNEQTEGAFDISIYPIMEAWGFTTQEYKVPSEEELEQLVKQIEKKRFEYDEKTHELVFKTERMKIDFGGIAKGYTSSRIMEIWKEYGMTSGMVNLGGNVQVLGTKTDGSEWRIGIQNPEEEGSYLGVLKVSDKAVITSGGYERYFEENGVIYHHIIDPETGYPADSGLSSVTIVSENGTLADGLSTALFIMGKEEALSFWGKHKEEFDVILLTEQNEVYITDGIADGFSSQLPVTVIH